MSNQDYKNAALAALKGRWAPAVLATVVFMIIAFAYAGVNIIPQYITTDPKTLLILSGVSILLAVLLYKPLSYGYYGACRRLLVEGDDQMLHNMVSDAFSRYFRVLWAVILTDLKIIAWCLLLLIPGIVMSFAYAMTPFIISENQEIPVSEAIHLSRKMMKGHKFDLFYLILTFIGWIFLSILTLGIGLLWLAPYMTTAMASFYEDVKEQYRLSLENQAVQPQPEQ